MVVIADFWLKVGDDKPAITATLLDADGNPVDIGSADVEFVMHLIDDDSVILQALAENLQTSPDNDTRGKVRYQWVVGDTDTAGGYWSEWLVTFADVTQATFPNDDYKRIAILERLVEVSS